jgi:hypothetical protein
MDMRGLFLLVAILVGTMARADEPSCISDAQCDAKAKCDWKLGCVPLQVRATPRPTLTLVATPTENARNRRVIGSGLGVAGLLVGAAGTGLFAAAYAIDPRPLGSPTQLGGFTMLAIGGAMAAPGLVLRAIGAHDSRHGAEHAAAHARKRWRVGAGLLAAGAALAAGSLGFMALGDVAPYATPSLFAVGGMLVTTGIPLLIAGGRDGGAAAPGTLISF